ncbi:hypothetical protein [Crateriforma spongiae]|uniref:hypothetical protein n=1 Tax=Crateriforma spongiae TaxID=2724528 RepID=UPI00144719E6|nr:hypothetical protein [Crateriforma spongiae]
MANTNASQDRTAALRTEMQKLDADTYQDIRQSYYAVADNLKPLADLLEKADADLGPDGPLLEEHYLFLQMYDLLRKSHLGGTV